MISKWAGLLNPGENSIRDAEVAGKAIQLSISAGPSNLIKDKVKYSLKPFWSTPFGILVKDQPEVRPTGRHSASEK